MGSSGFSFNPQLPTVLGFLGSITFASMILMMQFSSDLEFSDVIITLTGVTSFLFIISAIAGAIDERHYKLITKKYMNFVRICMYLGIFGILIIFPLIIYSFSGLGSIIIIIVEGITFAFYLKLAPKPNYLD